MTHTSSLPAPCAVTLRAAIGQRWPAGPTLSRRLLHGRGRCFPGLEHLLIDWHPPLLLVTVYQEVLDESLIELATILETESPGLLEALVVQDRSKAPAQTRTLLERSGGPWFAREDGLAYRLRIDRAQNIGFFPDMASGRRLLRAHAAGKTVLNLFAYTCSFSVAAMAGGAAAVVNLDMNRGALALGRDNHLLNGCELRRVSFLYHDLFKTFARLRRLGPFDIIVVDPPVTQGTSFQARKDWPRLLVRLPELLVSGGEIIACVSAPELGRSFLREQFCRHLPMARLLEEVSGGSDFPEVDPDKGVQVQRYRLP